MNWRWLRPMSWLDTRSRFVAGTPAGGRLLDLGSADGETLGHFAELRPDLRLCAVDLEGQPDAYPKGCQFQRADLEADRLRWPDGSMDRITCVHLIEHLRELRPLLAECARLLRPGGQAYFETPHPRSLVLGSVTGPAAGSFTMNFYDNPTHVRLVTMGALAKLVRNEGLEVVASGVSRNWLFAAAWPLLCFAPASRKKFTAKVHWLGWSAYLTARKPA